LPTSGLKKIKKIIKLRLDGCVRLFLAPSGDIKTLTCQEVEKYIEIRQRLSWESFDEYVAWKNEIHAIKLCPEDWLQGSCSCVSFQKDLICKHLIGVSATFGYVEIPTIAKTVRLHENRKRGRPKGAATRRALIVD